MIKYGKFPFYVVGGFILWSAAASYIYAPLADREFDLFEWWYGLRWFGANPWVTAYLVVSAFAPTLFILWAAVGLARRPRKPESTTNHGTARFGTKKEMLRDFPMPTTGRGILIGAVSEGKNAPVLYDDPDVGPGHSMVLAGPDGRKSTSAAKRIWDYAGPRVVLDPANEFSPIMAESLVNQGYNVHVLSPTRDGINVLDWIDVQNPNVNADITTAAGHVFDEKGAQIKSGGSSDPVWNNSARALLECLMSHMLFSNIGGTLKDLRVGLSKPDDELAGILENISQNSPSSVAAFLANKIKGTVKSEKTWASICFTLTAATKWMADENNIRLVSGNSMKTSDVLHPKTVVFADLSLRTLLGTPAIGRAVMGSLFNAVIHADGAGLQAPVFFELEEGHILGDMSEIMLMYTNARKYGAILQLMLQSDFQLNEAWGENRAAVLRNCCSWISYNSIQDLATAERLEKICDTHGVMATSFGSNRGQNRAGSFGFPSFSKGNVENDHEIKKSLISHGQIMRSPSNRMWVTSLGRPYVLDCFSAPFYNYPSMANRMDNSRFNRKFQRQKPVVQFADLED